MFPFARTDVLINGVKMTMMTHHEDKVIGEMVRSGQHIRDEVLDYLQNEIKPENHVLDVGLWKSKTK